MFKIMIVVMETYNYKVIELRLAISLYSRNRLHENFPKALLWETYFCCWFLRICIPMQFSEKVIIRHTWYIFSYIHLSINLYISHFFDESKQHQQHSETAFMYILSEIYDTLYEWENIPKMHTKLLF